MVQSAILMDISAVSNSAPRCGGVGHLILPPAWSAARHAHDFVEVMVVLGGSLSVEMGGRTITASTGDVLYYPAGAAHAE